MPQGISADLIATKYGFSRDDVDAYAVEIQKRAAQAWDEGRFAKSVVPVQRRQRPHASSTATSTCGPRPTCSRSRRSSPPSCRWARWAASTRSRSQAHPEVERVNHVHHAGNSSGIVDGAAAVLVGSKEAGERAGLKPRARIRAFAIIGSDPALMLTGPVDVTEKVLRKRRHDAWPTSTCSRSTRPSPSVVLRYMQAFDLDPAKVNVNGGAIAMGHPLGATGAMILGTVLDELERTGQATALVTLCVAAGMGTATIIERV